jgi:hypothetical protein
MQLLHRETVVVLLVMLVPIACIGCKRAVSEVLPDEPDTQATAEQKVEEQGAAGEVSEAEAPGDRPAANPEPAAAAEPAVVPEVPQNDAAEKNASAAESPGDAVAPVPPAAAGAPEAELPGDLDKPLDSADKKVLRENGVDLDTFEWLSKIILSM